MFNELGKRKYPNTKNQIVMCNTKTMTTQKAIRGTLLEEKFDGQGNLLARVGSFLIGKKRIHSRELHRKLCLYFQLSTKTSNHYLEYLLSVMSTSW